MTTIKLEQLQIGLLELIKDRPTILADPYLKAVARSNALPLVREISASWRSISLDTYAPFTTTLLKQRGELGAELAKLIETPALSPFHADLRERFLLGVSLHADPLVAAVATFERALGHVFDGTLRSAIIIDWPVDPYPAARSAVDRPIGR